MKFRKISLGVTRCSSYLQF